MAWYTKKKKRIGIDKIISRNNIFWEKEVMENQKRLTGKMTANEQKIIVDVTRDWFGPIVGGGVFSLITTIYVTHNIEEAFTTFIGYFILLVGYGFGGFQLIYGLFRPRLIFTFDRLTGMVTYPEVRWNSTNTIAFKDSEWVIKYNVAGRFFTGMSLSMVQRNGWSAVGMLEGDFYDLFSFIVWFMDKNRPLPPGTFFDSQRKADFERRRAEGFPRPLYEATISIPRK